MSIERDENFVPRTRTDVSTALLLDEAVTNIE